MAPTNSDIAKSTVFGIISLVAIVGNIIVAYVLIKRRKVLLKNRATYQFILNLTFSDLVINAFLCPFKLTQHILGSWIFGTVMCKIIEYVQVSAAGTAVITHALIAVDRYRCLAHPHLPRFKQRRVKQMIALAWVFPAIVSAPFLYMFQVVVHIDMHADSDPMCLPLAIPVPWLDKLYEAIEFVFMFLSPFCVISWCYYHVIILTVGDQSGAQIPVAKIAFRRSKKRVTKTACLIMGAFIICWSPTFVLSIWRIASGTESVHQGHLLYEIAMFGGLINEATNPVIYSAFDRNMNVRHYIHCVHRVSNDGINEEIESSSKTTVRHRRNGRNTIRQLHVVDTIL